MTKTIIALTDTGQRLGSLLQSRLPESRLWFKPEPFGEQVRHAFQEGDALIMICAMGIVIRTLAPVLTSKHDDPAVVVLDDSGRFVIPVLSGHEGGANALADDIAGITGGQAVITTAGSYLRPIYTAGMGCERNCDEAELEALLVESLGKSGLALEQIDSLNSIDIKHDEPGFIQLSERLKLEFQVFHKDQLSQEEANLSCTSDYVFETVGVYGVAESAALYAARQATGNAAELVLPKQKSAHATCAIARSYSQP